MFKFSKDLDKIQQMKMNNILDIGKGILDRCEVYELHPIYNLIRIIHDSYSSRYLMDFLSQNSDNFVDSSIRLEKIFFPNIKIDTRKNSINEIIYKNKVEGTAKINFAVDSIISSPWSRNKFIKNICNIGNGLKMGCWNNDKQNCTLILPIGIIFIYCGGNHSISIASSEHLGNLTCKNIVNIDYLYDHIYFDGINYRDIKSNSILAKNCCFEYVTIFELGRLIKENGVNYKNIELY